MSTPYTRRLSQLYRFRAALWFKIRKIEITISKLEKEESVWKKYNCSICSKSVTNLGV